MKRILWLIFGALALAAASLLFRFPPEQLAGKPIFPEHPPDVRVEHEFVTASYPELPVVGTEAKARARLSAGSAQPRQTPPRQLERSLPADEPTVAVARHETRDRTLLEKARRAFIGDGRHRPEPFPRVKDN